MNDWLSKGNLKNDTYKEFFVMENVSAIIVTGMEIQARDHWQKAYVVRAVNLSELQLLSSTE
jgi:hypothetical protein